eukprot:2895351-Alexandrium_andersonii.AAC.2
MGRDMSCHSRGGSEVLWFPCGVKVARQRSAGDTAVSRHIVASLLQLGQQHRGRRHLQAGLAVRRPCLVHRVAVPTASDCIRSRSSSSTARAPTRSATRAVRPRYGQSTLVAERLVRRSTAWLRPTTWTR